MTGVRPSVLVHLAAGGREVQDAAVQQHHRPSPSWPREDDAGGSDVLETQPDGPSPQSIL